MNKWKRYEVQNSNSNKFTNTLLWWVSIKIDDANNYRRGVYGTACPDYNKTLFPILLPNFFIMISGCCYIDGVGWLYDQTFPIDTGTLLWSLFDSSTMLLRVTVKHIIVLSMLAQDRLNQHFNENEIVKKSRCSSPI